MNFLFYSLLLPSSLSHLQLKMRTITELDNIALRTTLRDLVQLFVNKYDLIISPWDIFRGNKITIISEHSGNLGISINGFGRKIFNLGSSTGQESSFYNFQISTDSNDNTLRGIRYVKNNDYRVCYIWWISGRVQEDYIEDRPEVIQEAIDVIAGILAHGEFSYDGS